MNTGFETKEPGAKAGTHEWLTPPYIIKALGGAFDLDPCSPVIRVFETAKKYYTANDDGLIQDWEGWVWCNPPYGEHSAAWLEKCARHGDCLVLIFARTDTKAFQKYALAKADAMFFIEGRLKFYKPDGTQGGTAGAPSVLVAYGERSVTALKNTTLKGKFVNLRS